MWKLTLGYSSRYGSLTFYVHNFLINIVQTLETYPLSFVIMINGTNSWNRRAKKDIIVEIT
jgi:hypothetical protein